MKKKQPITHEEVRDALKRFVRKGGNIDKLPDQKSARTEFIGNEKYDTYEKLSNLCSN